jgi:hypothetical protein
MLVPKLAFGDASTARRGAREIARAIQRGENIVCVCADSLMASAGPVFVLDGTPSCDATVRHAVFLYYVGGEYAELIGRDKKQWDRYVSILDEPWAPLSLLSQDTYSFFSDAKTRTKECLTALDRHLDVYSALGNRFVTHGDAGEFRWSNAKISAVFWRLGIQDRSRLRPNTYEEFRNLIRDGIAACSK